MYKLNEQLNLEYLKRYKIVIFGAGKRGELVLNFLEEKKYKVINFCDNSLAKQGKKIKEIPIISLEEVRKLKEQDVIIVIASMYKDEIKRQLREYEVYKFIEDEEICAYKSITPEEFTSHIETYNLKNKDEKFVIEEESMYPILGERDIPVGTFDINYFLQDIWAAKRIYQMSPTKHYDIGSRVEGFISHLLSFRENIITIDIRPLEVTIDGLSFLQSDAMKLDNIEDNSIESLSSLHAIEHFGLGRYGDPIDPEGCFKAMNELQRVLQRGGRLYFSVPIGSRNKLFFNAHRIFNPNIIIEQFDKLELVNFSFINEFKGITTLSRNEYEQHIGDYIKAIPEGYCGMFEFIKK